MVKKSHVIVGHQNKAVIVLITALFVEREYYFSFLTPLKGVGLLVFLSRNRPVALSRLIQFPFGPCNWLRPFTAPIRPFPGSPFFAMKILLSSVLNDVYLVV